MIWISIFITFACRYVNTVGQVVQITAYESISQLIAAQNETWHIQIGSNSNEQGKFFRPPSSLSILMNFDQYGTSSVQLANAGQIYWSDASSRCRHGKLYDPLRKVCRDMFCLDGYQLGPQGCVPVANANSTNVIHKSDWEISVELNLVNVLCSLWYDSAECVGIANLPLVNESTFLEQFQFTLTQKLNVNMSRLKNVEVVSVDFLKSPVGESDPDGYRQIENFLLKFTIRTDKSFANDTKDCLQLFYEIMAYGMSRETFLLLDRTTTITNVTQVKSADRVSWCNGPGDKKHTVTSGLRILASFDADNLTEYSVYACSTGRIYATGYFYLVILFSSKSDVFRHQQYGEKMFDYSDLNSTKRELDDLLNDYTDVTDFLMNKSAPSVQTFYLGVVCDRAPRIRVDCIKHSSIRMRTCELEYVAKNRSFCWPKGNYTRCYSVDEYEYDSLEPERYIRVCERENDFLRGGSSASSSIFFKLPEWLSFFLSIISLTFMIIALLTYFLFKELRNIPGWNVINLTLALSIAQFSFLIGSFVNHFPTLCFLNALVTHYSFLASFFCMNVIAFDLFRNFRQNASHILLHRVKVKSRLIKYVLYAWLAPLLIVIVCLADDFVAEYLNSSTEYRPCYASYLPGCDINKLKLAPHLLTTTTSIVTPLAEKILSADFIWSYGAEVVENTEDDTCGDELPSTTPTGEFLAKSCWIRNGRANLLFFGLPIAVIIVINAAFYFMTIFNIRKRRNEQKQNQLRRITRVKLPTDEDVKFYIQMAALMGFTWILGFLLVTTNHDSDSVISLLLLYLFLICNGSNGVFIFFAFIYRAEVMALYKKLASSKLASYFRIEPDGLSKSRKDFTMRLSVSDLEKSTSNRTSINSLMSNNHAYIHEPVSDLKSSNTNNLSKNNNSSKTVRFSTTNEFLIDSYSPNYQH